MVETENIVLPTTGLRGSVENWTGAVYSSLSAYLPFILLVVGVILLIYIGRKLYFVVLARKARKTEFCSTNTWFSWEDYKRWQEERKEE